MKRYMRGGGTERSEIDPRLKEIVSLLQQNKGARFRRGVLVLQDENNELENFSIQWAKFQKTQFDSCTGLSYSEDRLRKTADIDLNSLRGKLVIELGSGAGRFTEILLKHGAIVVSVDLSNSIFVNQTVNDSLRALFVQGDLHFLETLNNKFDFVFCYGVIQHTPKPASAYHAVCKLARPGGYISIDHYIKKRRPSPTYHPKYLWRPLTTRIAPRVLLKIIEYYMPFYLPVDTLIQRSLPKPISMIVRGLIPIPCFNYYGRTDINQEPANLLEWAILDTFDALGARYDNPATPAEISKVASSLCLQSFSVTTGGNGVILNAIK